MKLSDSFDARRLRPRRPRVWRWRLAAAFAALVASLGDTIAFAVPDLGDEHAVAKRRLREEDFAEIRDSEGNRIALQSACGERP